MIDFPTQKFHFLFKKKNTIDGDELNAIMV